MTEEENNVKLNNASSLKLNVLAIDQVSSEPNATISQLASPQENQHCLNVYSNAAEPTEVNTKQESKTEKCQPEFNVRWSSSYQKDLHEIQVNSGANLHLKELPLQNVPLKKGRIFLEPTYISTTMGNQHSEKRESDNDTPDEQNPTCCKPPRRKSKDKSSKRISNRSDDNDFDTNEVYPFDSKYKDDKEIVEPVDLEPFEIIETDDLSFIAGAGTSDVISSGSDSKCRLSREIILEEPSEDSILENQLKDPDNTSMGDKKNVEKDHQGQTRVTAGAPDEISLDTNVKSDTKTQNKYNPSAEVNAVSEDHAIEAVPKKDEDSDTKSHSCIEKSEKRNSGMTKLSQVMFSDKAETKEHILKTDIDKNGKSEQTENKGTHEKPLLKLPERHSDDEQDTNLRLIKHDRIRSDDLSQDTPVYENVNLKGVETIIAKQAPIQTKVPVTYILTQEMFTKESNPENQTITDGQYETTQNDQVSYQTNIDSACIDIETTTRNNDILQEASHRNRHETVPTRGNEHINISNPLYGYDDEDSIIGGSHEENIYETVDANLKFDVVNQSKLDGGDSTLKSIAVNTKLTESDLSPKSFRKENNSSTFLQENDPESESSESIEGHSAELPSMIVKEIDQDNQSPPPDKVIADSNIISDGLYATIGEQIKQSEHEDTNENNLMHNDSMSVDIKSRPLSKTESLEVPPNDSNLTSSCEATVPPPSPASMNILTEENEDEEDETEHTLSNDMIDFGDVVCKRLSQLLEDQSFNEDETATTNVDQDSIIYFSPREFIDTSTGRYEMQEIEKYGNEKPLVEELKTLPADPQSKEDEIEEQRNKHDTGYNKLSVSLKTEKTEKIGLTRNESAETLKRASGDSAKYGISKSTGSSDDDLPEFFDPSNFNTGPNRDNAQQDQEAKHSLTLKDFDDTLIQTTPNSSFVDDLTDVTPTIDISREFTALPEFAKTEDRSVVQYEHTDHATGRRSMTGTESDLDISEQRDDMSTDSMYADDEAEETMDILFTKTYTEPIEGAEVFLSCTVVNSAYKDESKKREVWLSSDEALEYFEANASEVMSTAFMKAKKEMKDIQICLQNLRRQMDNFHGNFDDISLPDLPMSDSLSQDYHDARRKVVTD